MNLRLYQHALLDRCRSLIRAGAKTILLQSSTGSGKTVIASFMLAEAAKRGIPAWFVVHRQELVSQSVETLQNAAEIEVGVAAANHRLQPDELVQVCMVQSLGSRLSRMRRPKLIIWDECHHCSSKTYSDLFAYYPDAVHVGLTATPQRLDGTGLGKWFGALIEGPTPQELIAQGYLSKYRMFGAAAPDMTGIHIQAGDYNQKELAAKMEGTPVTGNCLTEYQKHAAGLRALIFIWSVEASKQLVGRFRDAGIEARHLDGKTHEIERKAIIKAFRSGTVKVISNVNLVGEGFDVPGIEAVFLLRPTQSLAMYLQQVGRGMRPAEGKDAALIFDHAGNRIRHGLPDDDRAWTLEGSKDVVRPGERGSPIRQCPSCYSVQSAARTVCRNCGLVFPVKAVEIQVAEGELQEVDIQRTRVVSKMEHGQAQTYEELRRIERARGYRRGWADHVFTARQAKLRAVIEKWAAKG